MEVTGDKCYHYHTNDRSCYMFQVKVIEVRPVSYDLNFESPLINF